MNKELDLLERYLGGELAEIKDDDDKKLVQELKKYCNFNDMFNEVNDFDYFYNTYTFLKDENLDTSFKKNIVNAASSYIYNTDENQLFKETRQNNLNLTLEDIKECLRSFPFLNGNFERKWVDLALERNITDEEWEELKKMDDNNTNNNNNYNDNDNKMEIDHAITTSTGMCD